MDATTPMKSVSAKKGDVLSGKPVGFDGVVETIATPSREDVINGKPVQFSSGGKFAYAQTDDGGLDIKGWASTNKLNVLDVIVEPESFTPSVLREFKVNPLMLWSHNPDVPIGKWMVVKVVPNQGLWVEGHITPTSTGKDTILLIVGKVIKSLSIGFQRKKVEIDSETDVATITEMAHLYEVSIVALGVDRRALLQSQYSEVWERLVPAQHGENQSDLKGGPSMPEAPNLSIGDAKAVKEIVDERLEAHKPTLDQYATDIADLQKDKDAFNKVIEGYKEEVTNFKEDRITKSELKEYQDKIATDLTEMSERIQKSMNALALQDHKNKAVYSHWRDILGDGRHLTDDQGSPLGLMDQKAYALLQAPINEKVAGAEMIRAIRECNDAVVIMDAYMHAKGERNHHVTKLKSYKQMHLLIEKYFDSEFASAMAGGTAGKGAEWVPSFLSDRITEYARIEPSIANHFEHWDMISKVEPWPLLTGSAIVYRSPERVVANAAEYKKSTFSTADVTFTAQDFIGIVPLSTDMIEDSIIAAAPMTTRALAVGHNEAVEGTIVNGDTTATHRDTAQSYGTEDVETAWMGLRYHALDLTTGGHTASMIVGGDATTDFVAGNMRKLRALMGARGVNPANLIYITSLNGYFQMLDWDEVKKPGTYGANATWLTGTLDVLDGSPIIISASMGIALADDGIDDADQADNTGVLCVHKPSFKIGHRRGVTVEAEKHAMVQQVFVIATQRISFQKVAEAAGVPVGYGFKVHV